MRYANNLQAMVQGGTQAQYYLTGKQLELVVPMAGTISDEMVAGVKASVGEWMRGMDEPPRVHFVRDARAALSHSRAAVVASGTATVEALVAGTPFVVVYRVSRLTFAVAKRLVRYPAEIGCRRGFGWELACGDA